MSLDLITDSGSYTGNGTGQSITIGWQPGLVVIMAVEKAAQGGGLTHKSSGMSSDNALVCDAEAKYLSSAVTLTSTGFSVGTISEVNTNAETYYWFAIREVPQIDSGSYTGDANSTQDIVTGRQPDVVMLFKATGTEEAWWKNSSMGTNAAANFQTAMAFQSIAMAFSSTGFTVASTLNTDGESYHYVALYRQGDPTQHVESGSYTGTGLGRTVTLGYQPKWLMIFDASDGQPGAFKCIDVPTDYIGELGGGYDYTVGQVSIGSTGFTLPAGSALNSNGNVYYYIAGRY